MVNFVLRTFFVVLSDLIVSPFKDKKMEVAISCLSLVSDTVWPSLPWEGPDIRKTRECEDFNFGLSFSVSRLVHGALSTLLHLIRSEWGRTFLKIFFEWKNVTRHWLPNLPVCIEFYPIDLPASGKMILFFEFTFKQSY